MKKYNLGTFGVVNNQEDISLVAKAVDEKVRNIIANPRKVGKRYKIIVVFEQF